MDPITIGWREWVRLPEFELPRLKAKIDTGARTSCLHAFSVVPFEKDNATWLRVGVHPYQDDTEREAYFESKVVDERVVTDSGGHSEKRYVISTNLKLGESQWPIEITLTNRDNMKFRMLIGRTAINGRAVVDPEKSFVLGKKGKKN